MKRPAMLVALLALVASITASPAHAITNGEPDGNGHPYVGILVAEWETPGVKQRFCSGTLIAPRIVLTAAHCVALHVEDHGLAPDQMWVSFDSVYDSATSTVYHGTMVADPTYHGDQGQYGSSQVHDIAVVHLDEAPPITPARLPTAGLLSSLDLRHQTFTIVGYGRTGIGGPHGMEPNRNPSVRNVGTQDFRNLQKNWLFASGNPSTGDSNWCYGDSGSGHYLGDSDLVVSVSAYIDPNCRAIAYGYRLDIESARTFLASQGVPLP